MENRNQFLNSIEFSTNDSEIRVKCSIQKGTLSFESTVLISSAWINPLLMYIQKLNPEKQIDEQMERINFPDGNTLYHLSTENFHQKNIDWNDFLGVENEPKKIRA
jgi:hypothetical protein